MVEIRQVYHVGLWVANNIFCFQVSASDPDSSQNGNNKVTYSILEGAVGMFEINNSSGWITTTKSLNASMRQNYHLIVQAADSKFGHDSESVHLDYEIVD